jgi:hypothetical protein
MPRLEKPGPLRNPGVIEYRWKEIHMKISSALLTVLWLLPLAANAQSDPPFENFFLDETLRVDYFHIGDASTEIITLDTIKQGGIWAGSRKFLIDRFNNGRYAYKVYDADSNRLLFSKGFDSYFGEYQTSGPAARGERRTFHESALIPFPRGRVFFVLEKRDRKNCLHEIFRREIDPGDIQIIRDSPVDPAVLVIPSHSGGDPHSCVDIAVVGEGYTREETGKFKADLERFTEVFFQYEPYRSLERGFNFSGVLKPSDESGSDEPRAGIFKRTALNSSFNALGSERYLLTEDNRALRDIAGNVPYDALMIMVNHQRYGGGGIYNQYCVFTAGTQFSEYIFIHEFGHSFSGLADEYYTSTVAYNDFYPEGVEPLEPNITALLDPEALKWKDLVDEGTPLPTPWEKEGFDALDSAWQKRRAGMNDRIAELKRSGAPAEDIARAEAAYAQADKEHSGKIDAYLARSRWRGKVGAFKGAGYSSEGLYRPTLDCIMFSKGSKPFCRVCAAAVERVIRHYFE